MRKRLQESLCAVAAHPTPHRLALAVSHVPSSSIMFITAPLGLTSTAKKEAAQGLNAKKYITKAAVLAVRAKFVTPVLPLVARPARAHLLCRGNASRRRFKPTTCCPRRMEGAVPPAPSRCPRRHNVFAPQRGGQPTARGWPSPVVLQPLQGCDDLEEDGSSRPSPRVVAKTRQPWAGGGQPLRGSFRSSARSAGLSASARTTGPPPRCIPVASRPPERSRGFQPTEENAIRHTSRCDGRSARGGRKCSLQGGPRHPVGLRHEDCDSPSPRPFAHAGPRPPPAFSSTQQRTDARRPTPRASRSQIP